MRKLILVATLLLLISISSEVVSSADSKIVPGSTCQVINVYKSVGSRIFLCMKAGEKKLWVEAFLKATNPQRPSAVIPSSSTAPLISPPPSSSASNQSPTPSPTPTPTDGTVSTLSPVTIAGTTFPWPAPSGDIDKYQGIPRNKSAVDLLGLSNLHKSGITGKGFAVAFIDGSILASHPDFAATNVLCVGAVPSPDKLQTFITGEKKCPVDVQDSHGQSVAGTIGGQYGVAPGAQLISIATGGYIQSSGLQEGLNWVLQNYSKYNIVAVSVSVGEYPPDRKLSNDELVCGVLQPKGLTNVLGELSKLDLAVVFSAGNAATINFTKEPNCLPGVITVGAEDSSELSQVAHYSSISSNVDLLAPADFSSSGLNGDETVFGGTSQAAPFAAGLFALAKQARPEANVAQILYYLKATGAAIDDWLIKKIPAVRPVEMIAALQAAKTLPPISLVQQIQSKTGS